MIMLYLKEMVSWVFDTECDLKAPLTSDSVSDTHFIGGVDTG